MTVIRTPPLLLAAAGIGLCALAGPDAAAGDPPEVYGTRHAPEELYAIDLNTGKATLATDQLSATMVAAAFHPHEKLVYMVDNGGVNPMYAWDPATGDETLVNSGEAHQYHRFGFDNCGRLWGVELNSKTLYEIDPQTGVSTKFGSMSGLSSAGSTGDLAFRPGDKDGFHYVVGTSLYYVPFATLIGEYKGDVGFETSGLAWARGKLFACSKWDLWELDPSNGAASYVGSFGLGKINDISSAHLTLALWADDSTPAEGDPITVTAFEGRVGSLQALALTSFDGVPFFQVLKFGRFDATGTWSFSASVPPGLSGHAIGLATLGIDRYDDLCISPELVITVE